MSRLTLGHAFPDERDACRKLWADVDALLQSGSPPVLNP